MVTSIWKLTKFVCGNDHDEECEMKIDTDYEKLMYRCPKCRNKFSINDCQKIVDRISKVIYNAEMNNEIFDLEDYQYRDKGMHVKVIKYDRDEIKIAVKNTKELEK